MILDANLFHTGRSLFTLDIKDVVITIGKWFDVIIYNKSVHSSKLKYIIFPFYVSFYGLLRGNQDPRSH